jgi:hypothetical protein
MKGASTTRRSWRAGDSPRTEREAVQSGRDAHDRCGASDATRDVPLMCGASDELVCAPRAVIPHRPVGGSPGAHGREADSALSGRAARSCWRVPAAPRGVRRVGGRQLAPSRVARSTNRHASFALHAGCPTTAPAQSSENTARFAPTNSLPAAWALGARTAAPRLHSRHAEPGHNSGAAEFALGDQAMCRRPLSRRRDTLCG